LGEDGAGGVVHRGEQVDLPAVVALAPRSVLSSTATARRTHRLGSIGGPRGDRGHRPGTGQYRLCDQVIAEHNLRQKSGER
jgi:hypothetical protein